MGGEQDGGVSSRAESKRIASHARPTLRIHPRRGFVEKHDVRVADERDGEGERASLPTGERPRAAIRLGRQTRRARDLLVRLAPGEGAGIPRTAEEAEVFAAVSVGHNTSNCGHTPLARARSISVSTSTAPSTNARPRPPSPRRRPVSTEMPPHLPRAVVSEEGRHPTATSDETKAVHRGDAPERDHEISRANRRGLPDGGVGLHAAG